MKNLIFNCWKIYSGRNIARIKIISKTYIIAYSEIKMLGWLNTNTENARNINRLKYAANIIVY